MRLSTHWVLMITNWSSTERRRLCMQIFSRNTSQEGNKQVQEYPRFPARCKMISRFRRVWPWLRTTTTRQIMDTIKTFWPVMSQLPKIYSRLILGYRRKMLWISIRSDQNRELQSMVQRFREIFSDRLGYTSLGEHRIDLTFDMPVCQTAHPVPIALQPSLKEELEQMEDLGIIRKCDSQYVSPVVVVKKRDGSNRICIDFRRFTKITVTEPQPIPSPAESFLSMSKDKYFSKIDLTKGYPQIRVRPSDVHETALRRWVNITNSCGCHLGW